MMLCFSICRLSVIQIAAQRLAICNDIGEASYIDSLVAAALVIRCKLLPTAPQLLQVKALIY